MKVKVKTFATLREIMDKETELDLADGTRVSGLLEFLCGKYNGLRQQILEPDGSLKQYVNILKNGRNVYFLNNLETVLDDGDVVTIFPPMAGG